MKRFSTTRPLCLRRRMGAVGKAWDEMSASFDRFCLAAGIEALGAMMEKDAEEACGPRHGRSEDGADIAGAEPGARLAFTAARSRSNGRGCATLLARSWRCRAGNRRSRRTGSASGR